MTNYLFVYGTLMQNNDNRFANIIQNNSSYIGKGFIYAKKHELENFPGIKLTKNKQHKTAGELYLISSNLNKVLKELDYYEGYDSNNIKESLFIRKEVTVITDKITPINAWVYEYARKIYT